MVIALVLSGGTGSRLGADIPKQYLRVQGRPVLLYCMETLHKSPVIDAVQIVAAQEWQEEIGKIKLPDPVFAGSVWPGRKIQRIFPSGGESATVYFPWIDRHPPICRGRRSGIDP